MVTDDSLLSARSATELPIGPSPAGIGGTPDAATGKIGSISCRDASPPARLLILATLFSMPYRVMRCAAATDAEVYVLGTSGAWQLRFSRHCRRFFLTECVVHGRDEALALEINHLVQELGITMVIPGDAPSTRALIACRDLIEARCFPLPSLAQFDALNNKWEFAQLCEALGIRIPQTRLMPDVATLAEELRMGRLVAPLVAKPLSRSGSGGVIVLPENDIEGRLKMINYRPIIVQQLILGREIGASVYAKAGKIEAFVAHRYYRRVYYTFQNNEIYSDLAKIVGHYGLNGVYNFDMILAPDQLVYYLECNPRFFFKINLSMLAGVNFLAVGLGDHLREKVFIPDETQVRFPSAVLAGLALGHGLIKRDWAMASHIFSDPLPYFFEMAKLTESTGSSLRSRISTNL